MSNTILLKKSGLANAVPQAANLALGETMAAQLISWSATNLYL
jgi:hypothetical protein